MKKQLVLIIITIIFLGCNDLNTGCMNPIVEEYDFKILTWNTFLPGSDLGKGTCAGNIGHLVTIMDHMNEFDIICLQELFNSDATIEILEYLNQYDYSDFQVLTPFGGGVSTTILELSSLATFILFGIPIPIPYSQKNSGLLVLSRHPIILYDTLIFDECATDTSGVIITGDCITDKGVLFLRIFLESSCNYIDIYLTHLQAEDYSYQHCNRTREWQMSAIASFMQKHSSNVDHPIFLVGDFNSYSTSNYTHYQTLLDKIRTKFGNRTLFDLWLLNGEANPINRPDSNSPSYSVTNSDDNERHDHIFLLQKFSDLSHYSNDLEQYINSSLTFQSKTLLGVDFIYSKGGTEPPDPNLNEYGETNSGRCGISDHTPLYANITFEIRQESPDNPTTP